MKTHRKYHRSSFVFWGAAFALTLFFCLVWGFKPSLAFGLVGSGGLLMLMAVQNVARKKGKPYLYQAGYAVFFGVVAVWSAWAIYTLQDRLGVALLGAFGLLSLYIALWSAWQAYKDYKLYHSPLVEGGYTTTTLPFPAFNDGATYERLMEEMQKADHRFNRQLVAKALDDIREGQPVYQKGEILYGDIDCTKPIGVVISTGSFEVKIRRPDVEPRQRGEDEFPYMYGMGKHNVDGDEPTGTNPLGRGVITNKLISHHRPITPRPSSNIDFDWIARDEDSTDYDPSGLDGKE